MNAPTNAQARLYYEAHVTIDPVPEDGRAGLQTLADPFRFRLAKLLMQKGDPSNIDTFMTGHGTDLNDITDRTIKLVRVLQLRGYRVRRYKIEDTVLDSRTEDVFGLLGVPA